ncbi:hypothetical protein GOP47_0004442 [Adiantum capillus-veneris]|uniref:Pentatricopeptide repeat-containing protein n=1 Tax=Adiantum capillus-veneris TaxID=13818 RepID=A0A9D4V840_ADICA|nr:hypothetical protein GOP47_0004442 [Adiantum capillus-veneris]
MGSEGLSPDFITCILKACGSMQDAIEKKNRAWHFLCRYECQMWCTSKSTKARGTYFLEQRALIVGYAQQEQGQKAPGCYQQMQSVGLSTSAITYACILKACSSMQDTDGGIKIHADIVSEGLLQNIGVLSNVFVDMYVKCGALVWDVVS